eukprot:827859-Amorphochlora_amoeboformis.AAC.1
MKQKSGSKNASFFYASDQRLYDAYLSEFDEICVKIKRKGLQFLQDPRQFTTLRASVLKKLKVLKRSQPRPCFRCNEYKGNLMEPAGGSDIGS